MNICCIGAGYVGGPTMAMLAYKCHRYKVTVVDSNSTKIAAWNGSVLPIFEPGLDVLIQECRGRNLFFSTDIKKAIYEAEIIFISVNTPTKSYGDGSGRAADLKYVETCARQIASIANNSKIIVEKSTLPVRTAESIKKVLATNGNRNQFEIISNPEFLAEGSAIRDLEYPDRVLVGGDNTPSGKNAVAKIVDIYSNWVPRERIITTNLWSAELSKLVANALLAQRVSSINSVSALCEATGADVSEVTQAVGMDSRIGAKFLNASVGFGGSCFQKDILNLVYLCENYSLPEVAAYWRQVVDINNWQKMRFARQIVRRMFNSVAGKKIAVFGFAFKSNTNDTRESPAIDVCRYLLEEQAILFVHDPKASEIDIRFRVSVALGDNAEELLGSLNVANDVYMAVEGAHAIAVITDWDEYKKIDYRTVFTKMLKPAYIFDGRSILQHEDLKTIGFEVYSLGK